MSESSEKVKCPLLGREIDWGYCWELCNIAADGVLLRGDKVSNWDEAQKICRKCGRYSEE